MKRFKVKSQVVRGTSYDEVQKNARQLYNFLRARTKRRSYVRSAYFGGEKIFLDLFWSHLFEKENFRDKLRRLKLLPCAIELMKNSRLTPVVKSNPNKPQETLYRFLGITSSNELFTVQIKESSAGRKSFISVFPN